MTNIVLILLRISVETNFIPGWVGGATPVFSTNADGYLSAAVTPAIAIHHPPHFEIVTNYVFGVKLGMNTVELLSLQELARR